jgi:hypothetical protein
MDVIMALLWLLTAAAIARAGFYVLPPGTEWAMLMAVAVVLAIWNRIAQAAAHEAKKVKRDKELHVKLDALLELQAKAHGIMIESE